MAFLPDLVDCWIFRYGEPDPSGALLDSPRALPQGHGPEPEILLLRRSPGRILPGLWQCVSGSLEPGEKVHGGALRELEEETGIGPRQIEGFYDLDQVNQFHEPSVGAIVTSAIFAVRVGRSVQPVLSHEHDEMRWVRPREALALAIWPAYRESIKRIVENLVDPERAIWFELTLDGERARR